MNTTKGQWEYAHREFNEPALADCGVGSIRCEGWFVALMHGDEGTGVKLECKGNANLITTAVNACQAVNPANPLAAASAIEDLYGAALIAHDLAKFYVYLHPDDSTARAQLQVVVMALDRAENGDGRHVLTRSEEEAGEAITQSRCQYCRGVWTDTASQETLRLVQLHTNPADTNWQSPIWVCSACRMNLKGLFRYARDPEEVA